MNKRIALASVVALVLVAAAPAEAGPGSWLSGHVQNVGWTDAQVQAEEPRVATVGTTGRALRLEALRVNDPESPIVLRGHVQNLGWGDESRVEVGTTGRALRLEAVRPMRMRAGPHGRPGSAGLSSVRIRPDGTAQRQGRLRDRPHGRECIVNDELRDQIQRAVSLRLSNGRHRHHRSCIHNLPPEEQVAVRGWTVEPSERDRRRAP